MAIPASHIVEILPRVITGGSSDLELNGLLLSDSKSISASTLVLEFPSTKSVGDYFGLESKEYLSADVYFTSFNNKQASPKKFMVARRIKEGVPAWLRSAKNTKSLSAFKAITHGSLVINVNNSPLSVKDIDFSNAGSFSDVANILGDALGVIGSYSSIHEAFTFTSKVVGENSLLSFASETAEEQTEQVDLSSFMGLREKDGATLSMGMNALTESEQMEMIKTKTQNFVSFTTAWEAEAEEMLTWASWANSNYGWLYVAYTTNKATISPDTDQDPASILKASGKDHTTIIYGSLEYASFIMGVIASIAWQRVNGTITVAFKRQSGLTPWVVDESTASTLETKNCNYFGNFATRNAEFVFLYNGCLSSSEYGFIDPYINSVWLNNRLQVSLMDGISSVGRAPYNTRGYTMIHAWMMDPINEAKNNACIEAGVILSERQKSEITNEAGLDISTELMTQGYYIQILDPGASVRAKRGSPIISLWYTYGGAIQKIEVASTAIL